MGTTSRKTDWALGVPDPTASPFATTLRPSNPVLPLLLRFYPGLMGPRLVWGTGKFSEGEGTALAGALPCPPISSFTPAGRLGPVPAPHAPVAESWPVGSALACLPAGG